MFMATPLLFMRAADLSDVDNLWQWEVCVSEECRGKKVQRDIDVKKDYHIEGLLSIG
jgi:hypothetical protein